MDPHSRMQRILLMELLKEHPEYGKKIGVVDVSYFVEEKKDHTNPHRKRH